MVRPVPALFDVAGEMRSLDDIRGDVCLVALERYGGNATEAARRLGVSRSAFYRMMRTKGIDPDAVRRTARLRAD